MNKGTDEVSATHCPRREEIQVTPTSAYYYNRPTVHSAAGMGDQPKRKDGNAAIISSEMTV